MDKLKKIKHELRSVIISCRTAVTLNELCIAFKNFTGEPIPFSDFGYPDLESFLMDIPDVIDTVWHNGDMRIVCKRDSNDITLEALLNVIKHSKNSRTSQNFTGRALQSNQSDILIPRQWQDKITIIIQQNGNNCISIESLLSKINTLGIEIPTKRVDLVGILRRCWNLVVNMDRTMVYIKYREDHLKRFIDQILENYETGLRVEEFAQIYRYHHSKDLHLTNYGFDCVVSMFRYYCDHYSIFHEGNGMIKVYSKNIRPKLNTLKFSIGDRFIATIQCINDPHSFWIIPSNLELKILLNQLTDDIVNPENNCHDNSIKFNDVKVNHVIIAECNSTRPLWARCIVIDKLSDNFHLCVFFVDYGIYVELLSDAKLFSIPKNSLLLKIPRLAVHATLHQAKPIGKNWNQKSIKYFYHCISSRQLLVTVLDYSGNQLSVNISRNISSHGNEHKSRGNSQYADVTSNMAMHNLLGICNS